MTVQLSLGFAPTAPPHTFSNYIPGSNRPAMQAIHSVLRGQGQPFLYLSGPSGTGKTHLLQAACHEISERGGIPLYLPLTDIRHYSTEALDGLDSMDLVCLDDIHGIAGQDEWERAIFSLFNRLHELQIPLLISGACLPSAFHLKDLASRLNWGGVFVLQPLQTEEQRLALQEHARGLGLELPDGVLKHLLRHCASNMKNLIDWLEYLDQASLAAKRRPTLPFVRKLFDSNASRGY
jgi:DnaA family protein